MLTVPELVDDAACDRLVEHLLRSGAARTGADARAVLAGTHPPVLEVRKDVAVASKAGMGDFGDPQRHLPLPALDRWLDE